jgi:hypothetical protein
MLATIEPTPKFWESLNDARKRIREKIHFRRPTIRKNPSLLWQGGNDYLLKEGQNTAWIQIDDHCVYVRRTSKGIAIEIIKYDGKGNLEVVDEIGIVTW